MQFICFRQHHIHDLGHFLAFLLLFLHAEEDGDILPDLKIINALGSQPPCERRLSLPEQGQQHMLAADIVIPHHLRFIACSGDHRLLIQIHDHCPIILDFHAGSPDSMDSLYHSMKNPRPSRTAA